MSGSNGSVLRVQGTGNRRDGGVRIGLGRVLAAAVVLLVSGCGRSPNVATLRVAQRGWDTLAVEVVFEHRDLFGASSTVQPDSVRLTVFDAGYDTLYSGSDRIIAVRDEVLDDAEAILVEACGEFGSRQVCEQQTVFASGKRVWSGLVVDYPSDPEYTRGRYEADPVVERRVFDEEGWEELPGAPVPAMSAIVRVAGSQEAGLRVPLHVSGGRFDLSTMDGYRDFRFNLRSAFRDSGRAEVVFQVLARNGERESPAGSARIALVDRSEEELLAELQVLVRAAGRRLVARLRGLFSAGRTYVFIDEWSYDAGAGIYEVRLEFFTRELGSSDLTDFRGRLVVAEDGSRAVFHIDGADFDTAERWERRIGADSVSVAPLDVQSSALERLLRGW